tara:strand:- start:1334 stop:2101 length:768 start_codon:yes stop_codon:yes gene_type:complete
MTLAEIMASLQAGQAAGFGATGADLTMTAEGERRDIEAAQRQLREQQKRAEEQNRKRERRRGFGRAIGSGLGFLVGGSAGQAVGSAIGQSIAGAGQRVGRVSSGLGAGMFFSGAREDITAEQRDINRFIGEANRGYQANVLSSAVTDYFTGELLGKLKFPGAGESAKAVEASSDVATGAVGGGRIAGVGSSSSLLGGGSLSGATKNILGDFQFSNALYGNVGETAGNMSRLVDSDFISRARRAGRRRANMEGFLK